MGEHHWGSHVDGIDGYGSGVYTCEQDSISSHPNAGRAIPTGTLCCLRHQRAMRSSGFGLGHAGRRRLGLAEG